MKIEPFYLKLDSRSRISLKKLIEDSHVHYKAYKINGKIILEPVEENESIEAWIFKPENKKALESLKRGLKQKGKNNLGSFKKYLNEDE